jgi:hypothetical protein
MFEQERGNVIYFVFLAAVLFGALAFAVSEMLRGGDPDEISDEKVRLYVAEISNYGREMKQAIGNMRLSNGCEEYEISFANASVEDYEHSPETADNCKVFHIAGGGMNYQIPVKDWLDPTRESEDGYAEWYFAGNSCVYEIGNGDSNCASNADANDSDLVMILPYVRKNICVQMNKQFGIENPGDDPPRASGSVWTSDMTKFTGTFADGGTAIQSGGDDADILTGRSAGCFEGSGTPPTGSYHFYQVLLAR